MHIDEFRARQRSAARQCLHSLFMACRSRFIDSARLLEIRSPAIDTLTASGTSCAVDVQPLYDPFYILAERYVDEFFSPQTDLFAKPSDSQDARWIRYFHQTLEPRLISEDEVVRNTLRAVRALPSRNPGDAATALGVYFSEMTLPDTRPIWVPELHLMIAGSGDHD